MASAKSILELIKEKSAMADDGRFDIIRDRDQDREDSSYRFLKTVVGIWLADKVADWFWNKIRNKRQVEPDNEIEQSGEILDQIEPSNKTKITLEDLKSAIVEGNNSIVNAISSLVVPSLDEIINRLDDIYESLNKNRKIRRRPSSFRRKVGTPLFSVAEAVQESAEIVRESQTQVSEAIKSLESKISEGKTKTQRDVEEYRKERHQEDVARSRKQIVEDREKYLKLQPKLTLRSMISKLLPNTGMITAAGGGKDEGGMFSNLIDTISAAFAGSALWSGAKGLGKLAWKRTKGVGKLGISTLKGIWNAPTFIEKMLGPPLELGWKGLKLGAGAIGKRLPYVALPLLIGSGLWWAKDQPEKNVDFLSTTIMPDTWWGGMLEGGLLSGLAALLTPTPLGPAVAFGALTGLAANFLGSDWFKSWVMGKPKQQQKKPAIQLPNFGKVIDQDTAIANLKKYLETSAPNNEAKLMSSVLSAQKELERQLSVVVNQTQVQKDVEKEPSAVAPVTSIQQNITNVNNAISAKTRPFMDDPSVIMKRQMFRGVR